MNVYVINLGIGNYAWEKCKKSPSIAVMDDEDLYPYWRDGDKEGYMAHCYQNKKDNNGNPVSRQLSSMWFNYNTTVSESSGDIWLHRQGEILWWTKTTDDRVILPTNLVKIPNYETLSYELHKPCAPWSDKDKNGRQLIWQDLHPQARSFLWSRSTLNEVGRYSPDKRAYALALINGEDLSNWHDLPGWREKAVKKNWDFVDELTAREASINHMVNQAEATSAASNGQTVERTLKNKKFVFESKEYAKKYLDSLIEKQTGLCALSGLPLQFEGIHSDPNMLCSLDRIDSDGHYVFGNLQVVCRFINFWKSDSDDREFRRLLDILQN